MSPPSPPPPPPTGLLPPSSENGKRVAPQPTPPIPSASSAPDDVEEARLARAAMLRKQRTRELVLQGRRAPKVEVGSLNSVREQRAALDRCCALYRMILSRDQEIDKLSRELVEAKHKLSNARLGVGPLFELVYECDVQSRLPTSQIAIMAMLSGALIFSLFI